VTEIRSKNPTTIWQQLGENKPYFKDEIDMQAKVNGLGLVGTSNSGCNLNNSEFFITLTKAHLSSLNGKHTVFGEVAEGFDVLKKINETYVDGTGHPHMNIRILHTFILEDPFEDPPGLIVPDSPAL
jgi:peptidyl-prolyl cis-trans isomerase-like 4